MSDLGNDWGLCAPLSIWREITSPPSLVIVLNNKGGEGGGFWASHDTAPYMSWSSIGAVEPE